MFIGTLIKKAWWLWLIDFRVKNADHDPAFGVSEDCSHEEVRILVRPAKIVQKLFPHLGCCILVIGSLIHELPK